VPPWTSLRPALYLRRRGGTISVVLGDIWEDITRNSRMQHRTMPTACALLAVLAVNAQAYCIGTAQLFQQYPPVVMQIISRKSGTPIAEGPGLGHASHLLAALSRQEQTEKSQQEQSTSTALTNTDVLDMLKAGLPPSIVIAKIKTSKCNFDTSPAALGALKSAGVPDDVLLMMVEAPPGSAKPETPRRATDELTMQFKRWQNSVVTVWSEFAHGTGFIVDRTGLVLTNQHVLGPTEYIAVQFDGRRKLPATLLAQDAERDIAVLWIDLSMLPEAVIAPIAQPQPSEPPVVEGERVFTIGSPLSQQKILTTGVVSKVEARAIISDININPGNSGGPLFSSLGVVAGMTTFHEGNLGAGLSGIVRIEEAVPLLNEARGKMARTEPPQATLLPVEPMDTFPLDAIKAALAEGKLNERPYVFNEGNYDVAIITPILKYYLKEGNAVRAAKQKESRTKRSKAAGQETFRPLEDLRNWAEYLGEYKPVILIQASPKLRETFGSALGRGLAAKYGGYIGPAQMRFKTDFSRMRLLCGEKEIQPILPGKVAEVINARNPFVRVTDATYQGLYFYPPDAISPECGQVALELYSEEKPNQPEVKVLSDKTVERVWLDFAPYRQPRPIPPASGGTSTNLMVSPSALSFGPVLVGQSRTLSVTLTNVSPKPVIGVQRNLKSNTGSFNSAVITCGNKLAPSSSCAFTITFTPSLDGPEDGTITISGSDNGNATVELSGSGTEVTLSTNSLNFGDVPVRVSNAKQMKINNHGGSAVTFNVSTGGSTVFSESDECGGSVPAHSSCTLTVTFTPSSTGPSGRTLTIGTSDVGSPTVKVNMKGTGTARSGN
jgi:S1-C subfamily serine protease